MTEPISSISSRSSSDSYSSSDNEQIDMQLASNGIFQNLTSSLSIINTTYAQEQQQEADASGDPTDNPGQVIPTL